MQRDRLLLAEIVDATERIVALTARRSVDEIDADRDRRDALLWNYTVLGEAVSQLSEPMKVAHPDVPWSDPVRMRNRIVHGYWSVDLDVLVTTAQEDLPDFLAAVARWIEASDFRQTRTLERWLGVRSSVRSKPRETRILAVNRGHRVALGTR